MKIAQKLAQKAKDNWNAPTVTIAFLGDSVTQGCFELYRMEGDEYDTVFDKNSAYHTYVAKILSVLYPSVPVNIINAGVSGSSAPHGLERLERDVLRHHPDLTVVCFGLNDCGKKEDGLDNYINALKDIFDKLDASGSEILFMTPNMMATEVSSKMSDPLFRKIAEKISKLQNEGILDMYLESAKTLCKERNIPVCDCYAKWKAMSAAGVDVTELLANKINHPTREMNWLFATSLVEAMLS